MRGPSQKELLEEFTATSLRLLPASSPNVLADYKVPSER